MPFDQADFPLSIPEVESDEVLQCLLRGREKIMRGWCQNNLVKGHSVCARGALFEATEGSWWMRDADNAAQRTDEFLATLIPARYRDGRSPPVVWFNNDPSTTHADVLALFDRAISARRSAIASR